MTERKQLFPAAHIAPRWRIWLAQIFGARLVTSDGEGVELVSYRWRGQVYVVKERRVIRERPGRRS